MQVFEPSVLISRKPGLGQGGCGQDGISPWCFFHPLDKSQNETRLPMKTRAVPQADEVAWRGSRLIYCYVSPAPYPQDSPSGKRPAGGEQALDGPCRRSPRPRTPAHSVRGPRPPHQSPVPRLPCASVAGKLDRLLWF